MANAEPIAADAINRIRGFYDQPPRAYHNWKHVEACLNELSAAEHLCDNVTAVRWAILFHDAIYDVHQHDNEEKSADLARDSLQTWGYATSLCNEVNRLILATKHAAIPSWTDGQIVVDIDLSILGQPPDAFDAYEHAIREEYSFVPAPAFREGRSRILQAFLARPRIYLTNFFHGRYETLARTNLARSIQQLA